jgi:hypothetical protein
MLTAMVISRARFVEPYPKVWYKSGVKETVNT